MRMDKLTSKFHEALSDAQTLALGRDHAYIEPVHVLIAMLKQDEGPKAILMRAGVQVQALAMAAEAAIGRLPQVSGQRSPSNGGMPILQVSCFCWPLQTTKGILGGWQKSTA